MCRMVFFQAYNPKTGQYVKFKKSKSKTVIVSSNKKKYKGVPMKK